MTHEQQEIHAGTPEHDLLLVPRVALDLLDGEPLVDTLGQLAASEDVGTAIEALLAPAEARS
jgi:hypothetical protein